MTPIKTIYMAKLIRANGNTEVVKPLNGSYFETEELCNYVDGYAEIVPAGKKGYVLVVNEDGKALGLPFNHGATLLADIFVDFIVGDVLYCKREEI